MLYDQVSVCFILDLQLVGIIAHILLPSLNNIIKNCLLLATFILHCLEFVIKHQFYFMKIKSAFIRHMAIDVYCDKQNPSRVKDA